MLLLAFVAGLATLSAGIAGLVGMKLLDAASDAKITETRLHSEALLDIQQATTAYKNQLVSFKNLQIRGNDPGKYQQYAAEFAALGQEVIKKLSDVLQQGRKAGMPADVLNRIDEAEREHKILSESYGVAIRQFNVVDPNAGKLADKLIDGKGRAMGELMAKTEDEFRKEMDGVLTELEEQTQEGYERTTLWVALLVLAGLGTVGGVSFWIMRSVMATLGGDPSVAAAAVRRVAAGDLSTSVILFPGDHTSLLAATKAMQEELSHIVADIKTLVARAAQGDFTGRIDIATRQGFGREIGESLNALVQTTDAGLADVTRVSQALARGDLSVTIEKIYPGQFGKTTGAINATVGALNEVVDDVRKMVDAAMQGDFSKSIDTDTKQGYPKTLAELLNGLNLTASAALDDISYVARALAEGDLTRRIEIDHPGLFGATAQGINITIERLRDVVGKIQDASAAINTAASEISAGNADLSRRTEEQASSLEETASSMEELNTTVKQNADNAHLANDLAQSSNDIATRGGQMVKDVVHTMNGIQDSSQKIADIIGVIDGIAFQTNILALNAAVEAARAGEQGRGFAVVASEVRNLAQRSATAAKEIKTLIAESVDKVDEGTRLVNAAGRTMDEVVASFRQVAGLVTEIAGASQEQSSGIQQVTQAVGQMDEVTQRNAALVEEAAAAAESLEEQSASLVTVVGRFKLPVKPLTAMQRQTAGGMDFVAAIDAHRQWKGRLLNYLVGKNNELMDPEVIGCDGKCALGQWIHGTCKPEMGKTPLYETLRTSHARFHRCAADIVISKRGGENTKARTLLSNDFGRHSEETIENIQAMQMAWMHRKGGTSAELRTLPARPSLASPRNIPKTLPLAHLAGDDEAWEGF
jgi:methyl-accepting chemotaxis protein